MAIFDRMCLLLTNIYLGLLGALTHTWLTQRLEHIKRLKSFLCVAVFPCCEKGHLLGWICDGVARSLTQGSKHLN